MVSIVSMPGGVTLVMRLTISSVVSSSKATSTSAEMDGATWLRISATTAGDSSLSTRAARVPGICSMKAKGCRGAAGVDLGDDALRLVCAVARVEEREELEVVLGTHAGPLMEGAREVAVELVDRVDGAQARIEARHRLGDLETTSGSARMTSALRSFEGQEERGGLLGAAREGGVRLLGFVSHQRLPVSARTSSERAQRDSSALPSRVPRE